MDARPTPRPFDQAFLDDLPYDPEVLLFDQLIEVDVAQSLVRCRMPTHDALPLTRAQRAHPVRHPLHVAGGLMVHATGMLGFVHAYHVLGLRHHEGWVGFGTHLHEVVFRKMVVPGETLVATCRALRQRIGKQRCFLRYALDFRRDDEICYEGEQSAFWQKTDAGAPPAEGGGA